MKKGGFSSRSGTTVHTTRRRCKKTNYRLLLYVSLLRLPVTTSSYNSVQLLLVNAFQSYIMIQFWPWLEVREREEVRVGDNEPSLCVVQLVHDQVLDLFCLFLENIMSPTPSQWNVFQGFVSLWKRQPTRWFHKFSHMISVFFQPNWLCVYRPKNCF